MCVCCSLSLLVGTTWGVVDGSAQNGGGYSEPVYVHTYILYIHTCMQQHQLHKHTGTHMHTSTHSETTEEASLQEK